MTRIIKADELHSDQYDVLVDGQFTGVIFHEPHAAQPGHRYEGKPYVAWTAVRCRRKKSNASVWLCCD